MGREIVAMILAGGRGTRLEALTAKVAKPAVHFGGKYRIIDFPLSNCANSGIDIVGVLTPVSYTHLGLSVAANNAVDDVKAACDYTTNANNNEGVVAELIEKFIFNEI